MIQALFRNAQTNAPRLDRNEIGNSRRLVKNPGMNADWRALKGERWGKLQVDVWGSKCSISVVSSPVPCAIIQPLPAPKSIRLSIKQLWDIDEENSCVLMDRHQSIWPENKFMVLEGERMVDLLWITGDQQNHLPSSFIAVDIFHYNSVFPMEYYLSLLVFPCYLFNGNYFTFKWNLATLASFLSFTVQSCVADCFGIKMFRSFSLCRPLSSTREWCVKKQKPHVASF